MKKPSLTVQITISLVLGIGAGLLLQKAPTVPENYIRPFGTVYLNLIKMIVIPVVTLSVIQGVLSLQDARKVGAIGGKTLLFFLCTTAFAVTIGLITANLLQVGKGYQLPAGELPPANVNPPGWMDTVINIFPDNILRPFLEGNMLPVILIAILFGFGILLAEGKGKAVSKGVDALAQVSFRVMDMILRLSPIGVFALIAPVIARQGTGVLLPLLQVILVAYVAYLIHTLLIYGTAVFALGKQNPIRFFKHMGRPMLFAFSSASSVGTLPFSMEATEKLGVPRGISGFVLPLGATVNMDGTAIYQGVCVIFIAQVFGVELTIAQQLTVVLTSVLASVGTAGVPGSGMLMLAMVLQSVGLPVEGIALVAGIDRLLDMGRTVVNITGDCACCVVVGRGTPVESAFYPEERGKSQQ